MSRPGGGGVGVGAGSAGTCFSGGSGSGGTYFPVSGSTVTPDAGTRGGAGSEGAILGVTPTPPQSVAGAGNPNGNTDPSIGDDPQYNGTGGVLIVFVEGTITTAGSDKHFAANGVQGRQMIQGGMGPNPAIFPFGGGTGGGIVILVNGDALSFRSNMQTLGGIVVNNGPSANFQSGGNGVSATYTFDEL